MITNRQWRQAKMRNSIFYSTVYHTSDDGLDWYTVVCDEESEEGKALPAIADGPEEGDGGDGDGPPALAQASRR